MQSSDSAGTQLHVAITGARGLIGSALAWRLTDEGHRVSALVRRTPQPGQIPWNPEAGILNPEHLEGVDAVVHLAGENVGARWTPAKKTRIRNSRVQGTRLLSETLARLRRPAAVLISASAVGIYGNRKEEVLDEHSPLGDPKEDFLAAVGQDWEAAADPARTAGIRVVHPRLGLVLSPAGGALGRMLPPFRLGLGGQFGSGSQWMSWIVIDDVVSALLHLLATHTAAGAGNVTSPKPVRNREFTQALGPLLSRPTPFPLPAAALRLTLGQMADSTLLGSARVLPRRLEATGFRFSYPDLEGALRHVLGKERGASFPA